MLRGRDQERAVVTTLLEQARAGRGGALVLRGEAGVGKSALLAQVVAEARDLTILRTQGVESESPLAFAGLHRLLRPVTPALARIPPLQAGALRAALGETAEGVPDRFLIFLATLSVLVEAADERPVLAVVDDAHWLDDASAAALLFVARRLDIERVALVFAAREGDARRFDAAELPSVVLGGLDPAAATELLSGRLGRPVAPELTAALLTATGGNPLALVELAEALSPAQLSGVAPLPPVLPLTEGVERAFLGRYHQLSAEARTVLLTAAADDSGRMGTIAAAARVLGVDDEGLEAAERSGLLDVHGDVTELRHPLVRSAVYGAATSTERRRVHRALAQALSGTDADRRAWHLAAAVTGPDEAVVAELDRAAGRAHRRGGHEAASAAWERAAELCAVPGERARLLHRAAAAAWMAAAPQRARQLAESAWAQATEPTLLADVARLRGQIEFNTASLAAAHRMILDGAAEVAPHDQCRAGEMAMLATALAAFGAQSGAGPDPTDLVPEPAAEAPARDRCVADLVRGFAAVSRDDWRTAAPHLRRALELADRLSDQTDEDLLLNLGVATWYLGDDATALALQDRLLASARSSGGVFLIVHALTRRNIPEISTGRWAAAQAGAAEAVTLAGSSGHRALAALPAAVLAVLSAHRGEDARAHLAMVEELAGAHPLGIVAGLVEDLIRWVHGLDEAKQPAVALHHLQQLTTPLVQQLAAHDRLEAAVRTGRPDDAAAWVDQLAEFAAGTGAAWATAAAEHGRALLGEGVDAEHHFRAALAAHAGSLRAPDRARTQLAYGEFLRRERRRVDAREQLRAALATFEDLGARPLAERARQELRASGETARRRSAVTPELTAQELQVARLVGTGLSNREVAAQLFLSPRTIDFHLRNVFTKLGITSRTELAALHLR